MLCNWALPHLWIESLLWKGRVCRVVRNWRAEKRDACGQFYFLICTCWITDLLPHCPLAQAWAALAKSVSKWKPGWWWKFWSSWRSGLSCCKRSGDLQCAPRALSLADYSSFLPCPSVEILGKKYHSALTLSPLDQSLCKTGKYKWDTCMFSSLIFFFSFPPKKCGRKPNVNKVAFIPCYQQCCCTWCWA